MLLKDLISSRRVGLDECGEITEKVVHISRVAKVVKGGRRFSFSALVVCGDGQGHVGIGLGKAGEVPDAIKKGTEAARKSIVRVPLLGTTVPHDNLGKSGPTTVVLRRAGPGTGVIAGSSVRAVLEAAGVKDILTKVVGSNNPHNVLQATISGLLTLKDPNELAALRGLPLEELGQQTSSHI